MKLILCIVSATPELFNDAVDYAAQRAKNPLNVIGIGNGCTLEGGYCLKNLAKNEGIPSALHEAWVMSREWSPSSDDVLAYIHDDVRILEQDWDERILTAFKRDPICGLAGFGGATALGGEEIYKVPYEVHQLGRRNFYSNMIGAELHGRRVEKEMSIVFTDGFSMFVKRELLDKIGGWAWWPKELVHHAYDYGIACMARRHGYSARLIPCLVEHRGGLTACSPIYQALADAHGGDAAVHAASHKFVYETFRDVLPLRI